MKTAIGVLAHAPLPGRCKTELLAAHEGAWVAGLYAAMLRDTLDGLQSLTADRYVVFVAPVPPGPGESTTDDVETRSKLALDVITRHVPSPWELVAQTVDDLSARAEHASCTLFDGGAEYVLISGSDAPSAPTEALAEAFADESTRGHVVVAPCEDGGYTAIALPRNEPRLFRDMAWGTPAVLPTTRARCKELGFNLRELASWYAVDEPSDVLTLFEEMRKNPERAPRTAQFLVKNA